MLKNNKLKMLLIS